MLLVSKYYTTHDSDLIVSLSIFLDLIDSFGRKISLSAKCVAKFVIESELLRRFFCRLGGNKWFSLTTSSISILGSATLIHASLPCGVITSFVIGIHSIMLGTTTPLNACASKIVFTIHADFVLHLSQMPCCDSVQILL